MGVIIGIIFMVIYITPITLLRAWVLKTLWMWYIAPTFDVDPLTMVQAFGLSLFVSVLSGNTKKDHKMLRDYMEQEKQIDPMTPVRELWDTTLHIVSVLLFAVVLGWIGIQFI